VYGSCHQVHINQVALQKWRSLEAEESEILPSNTIDGGRAVDDSYQVLIVLKSTKSPPNLVEHTGYYP
jgi:hypothetical protein